MPSETVENYLKAIHTLAAKVPPPHARDERGLASESRGYKRGNKPTRRVGSRPPKPPPPPQVSIGDLAAAVSVTPGTATTMVKKLAAAKLLSYQRYGGVSLTPKGERAALAVLRRHRLIETFLVRTLGMDWSEVHEEAERLEHAVSDRLLTRLDAFLGHPAVDPHGDPIPDESGTLRPPAPVPLIAIARCTPGARVRLARVLDQRADFLRFLHSRGLHIDTPLTILAADPGAGTLTLRSTSHPDPITLSELAAANLLVEPLPRR